MANEADAILNNNELTSTARHRSLRLTAMIGLMCALLPLSSCHCDHVNKPAISVGNLLCADGSFCLPADVVNSKSKPVAVVFYVNTDDDVEGRGYAVWLRDLSPQSFADSLGVSQGTSTSITDFEGNANTYALYACDEVSSQMAQTVFGMWSYGQSAYVPSVGQMRLLFKARNAVNEVIASVGGEVIPVEDNNCWYWTSSEVEGQEEYKAWLYSLSAGVAQETPKDQYYRLRPIITITD